MHTSHAGKRVQRTGWHTPHTAPRVPSQAPSACQPCHIYSHIYTLGKAEVPIQAFQHGEPGVHTSGDKRIPSQELCVPHLHVSLPSRFHMQEGKSSSFPREEDVLPWPAFPSPHAACPTLDVLNLTSLRKPTRCWAPHCRRKALKRQPVTILQKLLEIQPAPPIPLVLHAQAHMPTP